MLDLFISDTCPYCHKVMEYFDKNEIGYNKHDVSEPVNLEMLLKVGGKAQVPFLIDKNNGINMYESDDIITYASNLFRQ